MLALFKRPLAAHTALVPSLIVSSALLGFISPACADTDVSLHPGFGLIDSQPLNEIWLNPGFYSRHFQNDIGLDNDNFGFGAEYRFSTVNSVTIGRFLNSDRQYSDYAGLYYQPFSIGLLRLGAVVGGFNGYPHMLNGGWFLAAIPMISMEYQRVGLNIAFVPSYKDRLYGAISFQVKVNVWK
jgi:hypothetical protein